MRSKIVAAFLFSLLFAGVAHAQTEQITDPRLLPPDEYYIAKVLAATPGEERIIDNKTDHLINLRLKLLSGPDKGEEITINNEDRFIGSDTPKVGQQITVVKTWISETEVRYSVDDIYRLPALEIIAALFASLVIFFGRWKGFGALVGLGVSILVLTHYIAPQLLAGANPLAVTLIGGSIIAILSMFLAHGFNKRTLIALASMFITLGLSIAISQFFISFSHLFGLGSEEAFFLQVNQATTLNLQGLLLAGIIIGMLGILDDVTTAQAATIDELHLTDPSLSFKQLYRKGISVGREHIASLVNTLFLAYAGSALPLFLLFAMGQAGGLWLTINSEIIAEEIVRTLSGSIALILAVPISTLLAAYFLRRR